LKKSSTKGQDVTVGWAVERPDGGRAYGTTLGHFYENFQRNDCISSAAVEESDPTTAGAGRASRAKQWLGWQRTGMLRSAFDRRCWVGFADRVAPELEHSRCIG